MLVTILVGLGKLLLDKDKSFKRKSKETKKFLGTWVGKAIQPFGPDSEPDKPVPLILDLVLTLEQVRFSRLKLRGTGVFTYKGKDYHLEPKAILKEHNALFITYVDKDATTTRYGAFILRKIKRGTDDILEGGFVAFPEEMLSNKAGLSPIVTGNIDLILKKNVT